MQNKKWCCRIFPILLIMVSFFLSLGIWYFKIEFHSFSFLTDKNEIFTFIATVLFVVIIPIGIFYWLNDKENYQSKARAISLLGFLPAILLLIFNILQSN